MINHMVNLMQEKEAEIRFDAGEFSKAQVVPAPFNDEDWMLQLDFKKGKGSVLIEKKRGGERLFKTIDAACNTAYKIGFRSMVVNY